METLSTVFLYLLLIVPLGLELIYDIDLIKAKHKSPKHNDEFFIRIGIMVGVSLLLKFGSDYGFVQAFLMTSALHFLLFDYIMNLLMGKPLWYIGGEKWHRDDWFYGVQKALYGYPMFFFKLWFIAVALGVWIKPYWVGLDWVLF